MLNIRWKLKLYKWLLLIHLHVKNILSNRLNCAFNNEITTFLNLVSFICFFNAN